MSSPSILIYLTFSVLSVRLRASVVAVPPPNRSDVTLRRDMVAAMPRSDLRTPITAQLPQNDLHQPKEVLEEVAGLAGEGELSGDEVAGRDEDDAGGGDEVSDLASDL